MDDPPGFTPLADETGDEGDDPDPVFGEHESPSVNMFEPPADKTDVGDWFSWSDPDELGEVDLPWCPPVLIGAESLRG